MTNDPLSGQPYRALRLLGAGSMGEVFLAQHRELNTRCVVKIQHARLARDPSIVDRIRLEAEALARLSHPNIVSIIGSGQTLDERPFIVMECLQGQTMADELAARGQLPLLEALGFTCQLLSGLAAAHALGIVHRDIKPDNLFLCDGPRGQRTLKLLDFGVACTMPHAQLLGPSPLAVPTAAGTVVGALRYVSPEGALARRVDHRADLYSAALVLYFALAGRGPFDHVQSALLLLSAHVAEEPEPPSRFSKASIPAQLDEAVLRALRKAPDQRFQSADALREELERIMSQLRSSPDASEVRRLPKGYERAPESSGSRIRTCKIVEPREAPLDQAGPLQIGARFLDKYEIKEQIGRGGQAWVYDGQHIFTGREVAIKIIHSPRGMTREMLERGKSEARALGRLDHPNIVVMHDAGITDDGLFYIVMELLRGRSLRSALTAHGPFSLEEVLHVASSAAEALQAAHDMDLIHRDLTPDNVYLTRANRVKVLDFGIAKVLNEIGFTTHKDIVIGSILYMSPEQVQGLALDARSDIYALGLLMFEMLCGQHPSLLLFDRGLRERNEAHRRPTLAEIPPIQMNETPPLLCELEPRIPMQLAQAVQRAIAKNPADRFSTMREFVAALLACRETLSREAQLELPPASARDLSLRLPGESDEPPASQRATPCHGLLWNGSCSLTSVPPPVELVAATSAATELTVTRDDEDAARRRPERHQRSVLSFRNTLIGACAISAALVALGAFGHLEPTRIAPQARAELGSATAATQATQVTQATVASLSPAPPARTLAGTRGSGSHPEQESSALAADAPGLGTPHSPRAPRGNAPPAARATRTRVPVAATLSAQPDQAIADVSRPIDVHLDGKPRKDLSSNAEVPRKRLNGGKLIYGE
jgi:eukaryotic-like serine/threonine-protein kinase